MNWSPLPEGKFNLIAADPNWKYNAFSEKGMKRAPEQHYKTAEIASICALPVKDVAATNCHLMLWVTAPILSAGLHVPVMEAWGFKPSSIAFVWVKNLKHNMITVPSSEYRLLKNGSVRMKKHISHADFKMGLGHTTRQNSEFVILGRKGRPTRFCAGTHQLIVEPLREHSRKPEGFFTAVERYAGPDAKRLELFARQKRAGWTVWGNETDKFEEAA